MIIKSIEKHKQKYASGETQKEYQNRTVPYADIYQNC
jgi:hypothetical protein